MLKPPRPIAALSFLQQYLNSSSNQFEPLGVRMRGHSLTSQQSMLNNITTVLMALVFTALMLWFVFGPLLAPPLFRASGSTEISAGTVQAKTVSAKSTWR